MVSSRRQQAERCGHMHGGKDWAGIAALVPGRVELSVVVDDKSCGIVPSKCEAAVGELASTHSVLMVQSDLRVERDAQHYARRRRI
jgi:ABC-type uncharacterized transport system ATPase subunit